MTLARWRRHEWSPFRELARLQEEMDRMFDYPLGRRFPFVEPAFTPAIDLYREEDRLKAKVDLPGVEPKDIEVSVTGNVLTVRGSRKGDRTEKRDGYEYRERTFGEFERSIELPIPVDANKIEASFSHGVLDITLAVSEEVKPKQIEVKVK